MKKIILSLFLLFGISYAESSSSADEGEWKTFLGIEGGVGYYGVLPSLFVFYNFQLAGVKPYADSLGYNLAIQLGWQKYYSEKCGIRFILALRGDYMQNYKEYNDDYKQFPLGNGYGITPSFIIDWLFDFSVQGKKRYGMFIGIGTDIYGFYFINPKVQAKLADAKDYAMLVNVVSLTARLGFKAQVENDVFDITLNIPAVGGAIGSFPQTYFFHASINSTLTLGYKHLF